MFCKGHEFLSFSHIHCIDLPNVLIFVIFFFSLYIFIFFIFYVFVSIMETFAVGGHCALYHIIDLGVASERITRASLCIL